jgi:hypothetical protein
MKVRLQNYYFFDYNLNSLLAIWLQFWMQKQLLGNEKVQWQVNMKKIVAKRQLKFQLQAECSRSGFWNCPELDAKLNRPSDFCLHRIRKCISGCSGNIPGDIHFFFKNRPYLSKLELDFNKQNIQSPPFHWSFQNGSMFLFQISFSC